MLYAKLVVALACATLATASPRGNRHVARQAAASGGSAVLSLNPANVQTGSQQNGLLASGAETGEVAAATDAANFINFCTGKTLTNGAQVKTGSCNGIVMGDIPATTNMVSSIIIFPAPAQVIQSATTFNITVQMSGFAPGSFVNADANYYSSPQQLNNGNIVGHTHVTVQDMGGTFSPTNALDPTVFAFFKGINDVGNGQELLQAEVTGGLAAGTYRVCTMAAAANHQPVIMPVAQRGAQDDCQKFTVVGSAVPVSSSSVAAASSTAAASAASSAAASSAATSAASSAATSAASSAAVSVTAATSAAATATAPANGGGHHHHHHNHKHGGGQNKQPTFCNRDFEDEE